MILLKQTVFQSNHQFGIVIWRKLPFYGGQIAMVILIYTMQPLCLKLEKIQKLRKNFWISNSRTCAISIALWRS